MSNEAERYFLERIGEYIDRRAEKECSGWSFERKDATRYGIARDLADELIALVDQKREGE